jgi:hypothetical protein
MKKCSEMKIQITGAKKPAGKTFAFLIRVIFMIWRS